MKTFNNSSTFSTNRFPTFFRLLTCGLLLSMPTTGFSADETGDPTASFSAANTGVEQAVPVNFVNQSANAACYHWDFGDGTSSCEKNPQHTYSDDGTYLVKLTAINGTGAQEFIGTVDVIEQ